MSKSPRTVFSDLLGRFHDEDFWPVAAAQPTETLVGSVERIAVYRRRVELGQNIWHPEDSVAQMQPEVNMRTIEPRLTRVFRVVVGSGLLD